MRIDDARWANLRGGYRIPYDPRPALLKLQTGATASDAWTELWNELHHQGDVGEASYAAVPELVRIHGERKQSDWNTFALVATIELAREDARNPPIPAWLETDYVAALGELAKLGVAEIDIAVDSESLRAIFSIIAISKGRRTTARMLLLYTEDEWLEMENRLMS